MEVAVQDLDALAAAAKDCGLELARNQKTYRWWGTHEGDYPLPAGFAAEDLGKCDHALRQTCGGRGLYEVGVVRRRDGKPGYTLLWDFIDHRLKNSMGGEQANALRHAYSKHAAINAARRQGMVVAGTATNAAGVTTVKFVKQGT